MASKISLTVQYNDLPKFAANLNPIILAALDKGVARIEQQATADANFETGAMRASHYRITPLHDGYDAAVQAFRRIKPNGGVVERPDVPKGALVVGFAADYSIYPHDGTHNIPANPFLTRAAEGNKQQLIDDVQNAVNALIARHGTK